MVEHEYDDDVVENLRYELNVDGLRWCRDDKRGGGEKNAASATLLPRHRRRGLILCILVDVAVDVVVDHDQSTPPQFLVYLGIIVMVEWKDDTHILGIIIIIIIIDVVVDRVPTVIRLTMIHIHFVVVTMCRRLCRCCRHWKRLMLWLWWWWWWWLLLLDTVRLLFLFELSLLSLLQLDSFNIIS